MASAVQIPSSSEIDREIQQHIPALMVYRDAPEGLAVEVGGIHYWIPPDLHDEEAMVEHPFITECDTCGLSSRKSCTDPESHHPQPAMVKADGRLPVRALYGVLRDDKGRASGVGAIKGHDVVGLVKFLVENYGKSQGVVWLRSDSTDKARMSASRKLYLLGRKEWAQQEVDGRQEFMRRWNLAPGNAGKIPPPPTPTQLRGQEILDEEDAETRSEFICTVCYGYESDNPTLFARHMDRTHKVKWTPKDEAERQTDKDQERAMARLKAEAEARAREEARAQGQAGTPSTSTQRRGNRGSRARS